MSRRLLPVVRDNNWFFDTELLVAAERDHFRIRELPVRWVEDPSSSVAIVRTAVEFLRGIARLRRAAEPAERPAGSATHVAEQVLRFAVIGVVSTAAYIGLFDLLRLAIAAQAANALSLLVTAVVNTEANRRFTFGLMGRAGRLPALLAGAVTFVPALGFTSLSLEGIRAAHPSPLAVDAVLVAASGIATLVRFGALRAATRRS